MKEGIEKINVRVYGACIKDGKILILFEEFAHKKLVKLPGGGLELGEGLIECLRREFMEELNLEIENVQHFYTQEDFVQSMFRPSDQLLTVYYTADISNENQLKIKDSAIEKVEWIPLETENLDLLPIDRIVFNKLKEKLL